MRKGFLLLLLLPLLLQANPLRMQQRLENNQRIFSYHFRASEQDIRFQFALPAASIARNGNLLQVYVPEVMQQQLWRELQQQAQQAGSYRLIPGPGRDWQNFQVLHSYPASSPLAADANTERLQLQQQLQQFSRQYQQQYLKQAGYMMLSLPDNRQLVSVDHLEIIQQSLTDIAPVAKTIVSQLAPGNPRQLIEMLLTWIQLIPAHPAEQAEYGRSYLPPLQLLRDHQGDSASKTVLLAALIRSNLPAVKQALLYLPGRTVLALAIPGKPDELTVSLQGTVYLVVDPASSELMPPGEVARSLEMYIVNQFFAYRPF